MTDITTLEDLDALYGDPVARALTKETDRIVPVYRPFIEAAPFVVLATVGANGVDTSPRGDAPGFVRIQDDKTLTLPDRRGNNRIDSLRNIVADPRVALLFLIPGVGETLRVAGRARISTDAELCASFAVNGKEPRTVIVVAVEKVYYQCQKALVRSDLWNPDARVERCNLPTAGAIAKFFDESFDAEGYDAGYADYMRKVLY